MTLGIKALDHPPEIEHGGFRESRRGIYLALMNQEIDKLPARFATYIDRQETSNSFMVRGSSSISSILL
jgi:hypothetical protein